MHTLRIFSDSASASASASRSAPVSSHGVHIAVAVSRTGALASGGSVRSCHSLDASPGTRGANVTVKSAVSPGSRQPDRRDSVSPFGSHARCGANGCGNGATGSHKNVTAAVPKCVSVTVADAVSGDGRSVAASRGGVTTD
eukprot:365236-Chlamydomonas_euryale.AAC.1